MLVTALAPHIGYDNAAKIAKTALQNNTTLKYETLKTGLINEKDYNKINKNINKILSNVIFKKDDLQNKIYFKNLLNQAIKIYAG